MNVNNEVKTKTGDVRQDDPDLRPETYLDGQEERPVEMFQKLD